MMEKYWQAISLKSGETIQLWEDAKLYQSYVRSKRSLTQSRPGFPRHYHYREWRRFNGKVFLTNKRILFVGTKGLFRPKLHVLYNRSLKTITELKTRRVLGRGSVFQLTTGKQRKRIVQFSVQNPDEWVMTINEATPKK